MKDLKPHPPLQEFPSPQCIHDGNGEEAENETAAEDEAMIGPCIISVQV